MPVTLPTFRIFVSSPGDVSEERVLAERTIRRLAEEYATVARIEGIFWEHEPLAATSTFQAQLVRPSEADVAVCILWARLGTRLPKDFRRKDGSAYESGTSFEFEDAAEGFRANGTPALLVYRKSSDPTVSLKDESVVVEMLRQRRALHEYLQRWFHNQEDGSLAAAFHPFDVPARFEELLDQHLRKLIERRWPAQAAGAHGLWRRDTPFRGLSRFDLEHAPIFFGRSRATADVLAGLRARAANPGSAFVLILGMSGSGKSSLARAGVIPLLTQSGVVPGHSTWERVIMQPTQAGAMATPLRALAKAWLERARGADSDPGEAGPVVSDDASSALAEALASDPASAVETLCRSHAPVAADVQVALVVDQLEEIFTMAAVTDDDRLAFVHVLSALCASGRFWCVATMRSDFYARCEALPPLVTLMEGQGQYHLLMPTAAELAQIIRFPVRMAGLRLEEDPGTGERLEDLLLSSTVGNPGSLPLLEFTLEELYKRRRDDGVLSLQAYRALGGVEGALATRAEEVFMALDAATRDTLPGVLRRLVFVDPAQGNAAVRRSASRDSFAHDESQQLISAFVSARLFVADRGEGGVPTVSVAHEALIRHWPRVQQWLQDDREFLATRARVETAASLWRAEGESPLFLMNAGRALRDAVSIVQQRRDDVDSSLARFVEFSWRVARRNRLIRYLLRGAVALGTMLFLASSYLQWQANQISRNEARVQREQLLKQSELFLPSALELEFPGDTLRPDQTRMLALLLAELRATDFRGTVFLQGHLGRFRVVRDPATQAVRLRGARDRCGAGQCEFYPTDGGERAAQARLQAALGGLASGLRQDGIDVQVAPLPINQPLEPYPDSTNVVAWNAAARRNHRVEVRLVPAESQR
ncbi:MAG: hypothetical protein U5K74_12380 [Gemmatimonadaceae bacterium]|nr:hypothetical protein [Gemmatimonadaceae bacterium]